MNLDQFFQTCVSRLRGLAAEATRDGVEFEIVVALRAKYAVGPERWSHMRTFDGADALEDFYRAAQANVSLWDIDPTHLRHVPIDIGEEEDDG